MTTKQKQAKVKKVMEEFKAGTLKSSNGDLVTSRSQAMAIALSEAGLNVKKQDASEAYLEAYADAFMGERDDAESFSHHRLYGPQRVVA